MLRVVVVVSWVLGCSTTSAPEPRRPAGGAKLTADTPMTTAGGHSFVAPVGWTVAVRDRATILTAPEGDSQIALVDVTAGTADEAVAAAWRAYKPDATWSKKDASVEPARDGWSEIHVFDYDVPPSANRTVQATAHRAGDWTVLIYDMQDAVGEKRDSQVALLLETLAARGHVRETLAGQRALPLDTAQLAKLTGFVETALRELRIPGAALGVVQDGNVVFAGGFGIRELGKPAAVDADTKFMIASNTKALTTLMLAKLVAEGKVTWETPVVSLLASFALGDAATTRKVRVKHLVCACTGLPRQDFEIAFESAKYDAAGVVRQLATQQPTSNFGELYQYSNSLAAVAGFVGGHVAYPRLELGNAYDEAMRTRVFEPLGMTATTLDPNHGRRGNFAAGHALDVEGKAALVDMAGVYNGTTLRRPSGGAWSSVRDVLRYLQMEIDEGMLPSGARYIARDPLLARRAPQVAEGRDVHYGMGLDNDRSYGITVLHHGGRVPGYHSDMVWLPESRVGAVIMFNGDPGWIARNLFWRKLVEVLFGRKPEVDAQLAARSKSFFDGHSAARKALAIPVDAAAASALAAKYTSDVLGEITVTRKDGAIDFDFGEWSTEVASRRNGDGSTTFVTISPGRAGFEFQLKPNRTLVVADAQHEYVFVPGT